MKKLIYFAIHYYLWMWGSHSLPSAEPGGERSIPAGGTTGFIHGRSPHWSMKMHLKTHEAAGNRQCVCITSHGIHSYLPGAWSAPADGDHLPYARTCHTAEVIPSPERRNSTYRGNPGKSSGFTGSLLVSWRLYITCVIHPNGSHILSPLLQDLIPEQLGPPGEVPRRSSSFPVVSTMRSVRGWSPGRM